MVSAVYLLPTEVRRQKDFRPELFFHLYGRQIIEYCILSFMHLPIEKVFYDHDEGFYPFSVDAVKEEGATLLLKAAMPLLQEKTIRRLILAHEAGEGQVTTLTDGKEVKGAIVTNRFLRQFSSFRLETFAPFAKQSIQSADAYEVKSCFSFETAYQKMNQRTLCILKRKGVIIEDSTSTFVAPECEIGRGTILHPGCTIVKNSQIGEENEIGPYSYLENFYCARYNKIGWFCGRDSKIGSSNHLGPYTHFRGNVSLQDENVIGNFVEVKTVQMGSHNKMKHLSYFGNANLADDINVGCGVITANYDGKTKSYVDIEKGVFIGCNSVLIAPVTLERYAYIAASTTITETVGSYDLAIGRVRQTNKKQYRKD